ncbi:MAG: 2-oxoacid:acceptor oxidoreductase subunit alpha, partial [Asgard group archaeon]|nr:2-oxoacid:acceptor oxidoreductase subunit alpha [Asgard group archaeon]
GVIAKILDVEKKLVKKYVTEAFEDKGKKILNKNYEALNKGYEISKNLITEKSITCSLTKDQEIAEYILYNGAETVGMGAIAGGCNFICSYPMSPSTGVLVFLANHSHEFDILVEQAEDEIAAINSGLGAFYAGGRSMITTSGGGLALMGEGISLSGMTETPIVMHVAQRPGPATGLPTQTEQGDLELVMHSGHGFFPRIILAPGTLEEAFYLTQKAFNLADKYQVPVIVLTDQFLMDLHYNFPKLSLENLEIINHVVTTAKDYQRYKYTKNGISPRGIPGNGKGLVRADSDEHDQDGFITEDLDTTRIKMVEKRRKKFQTIQEDTIPPTLIGEEEYSILLVGWGSVFPAVTEALGELQKEEVSFLHFSQVFPLPEEAEKYLKQADKIVLIENNSSGQFGKHLQKYIGIKPNHEILKYNGMPFSVEELIENISTIMEEH